MLTLRSVLLLAQDQAGTISQASVLPGLGHQLRTRGRQWEFSTDTYLMTMNADLGVLLVETAALQLPEVQQACATALVVIVHVRGIR